MLNRNVALHSVEGEESLFGRAGLTPDAHRGLLLLARLAGEQRAKQQITPAPPGSQGFAWLAHRQIDALLEENPLRSLYNRIWDRQRAALVETMTALERRGIEALTFKGAEIHLRYFDYALGGMGDVDILVRRSQIEAARAELHGLGYRHGRLNREGHPDWMAEIHWFSPQEIAAHEADHYELAQLMRVERFHVSVREAALLRLQRVRLPVLRESDGGWLLGVCVDLHHGVAANLPSEPFFAAADPGTCGAALSMTATDLVWSTTSRYYIEVAAEAKRSLRDLAYVIAALGDAIDWTRVERLAVDYELGASLYYPLAFLRRAFGAAVPDAVLEASSPLKTPRGRDWGWQLGVLFDFMEPWPL
ncbi:MAG TPA: nucleotidyltransferase family protein [Bryobacteraceae bacterium]|nr:nucleotidyltransferase family protein [Bryobacteraceae bacterium]